MYLAYIINNAIACYLWLDYIMMPNEKIKLYPNVECQVSKFPPQSRFEYPKEVGDY
jgi:hypothetical protein